MTRSYNNLSTDLLEGWTILVVDDQPAALEVIEDVLSYYGAQVVTAVNGQVGLEQAQAYHPKLIIADIDMPVMDGWTLIARLKEDVHTQEIPVIALTAHAMKGDREKALGKGFHNYLSKPLDPLSFISQILVLLEDLPPLFGELQRKLEGNG